MFESFRKPKRSANEDMDAGFKQAFYSLPDSDERAAMSPENLAILLSQQEQGKPTYILVEHELNLRIALVQAKAAARASYVGLAGVVLGVVMTAIFTILIPWLQKNQSANQPHKAAAETNPDSAAKVRADNNVPAGVTLEVPIAPAVKQPTQAKKSETNK